MRVKRVRLILWCWASVLALCGVTALAWTISSPPELATFTGDRYTAQSSFSPTTQPVINLAELKQVMNIELRRPLHDPPPSPPPASPIAKPFPPLDIKLAGTIVEPGHNQAMIQLPDGSVQFKSVGDAAGDAVIRDIAEGMITLEFHGQTISLTVPKDNATDEH